MTVAAATASAVARRQLASSRGHLGTEVVEIMEGGGTIEKKQNRTNGQDSGSQERGHKKLKTRILQKESLEEFRELMRSQHPGSESCNAH